MSWDHMPGTFRPGATEYVRRSTGWYPFRKVESVPAEVGIGEQPDELLLPSTGLSRGVFVGNLTWCFFYLIMYHFIKQTWIFIIKQLRQCLGKSSIEYHKWGQLCDLIIFNPHSVCFGGCLGGHLRPPWTAGTPFCDAWAGRWICLILDTMNISVGYHVFDMTSTEISDTCDLWYLVIYVWTVDEHFRQKITEVQRQFLDRLTMFVQESLKASMPSVFFEAWGCSKWWGKKNLRRGQSGTGSRYRRLRGCLKTSCRNSPIWWFSPLPCRRCTAIFTGRVRVLDPRSFGKRLTSLGHSICCVIAISAWEGIRRTVQP